MITALALVVASFAPGCLQPPVSVPIAVAFEQPACTYCPGHRGLEYHPPIGTPVHAVFGGVVTFAGMVAGTTYVVVLQPDGLRATYGMLLMPTVGSGDQVAEGQVVGHSTHRLYFGLRRGDDPVDPTGMFGRWLGRPRLMPTDGGSPRSAPPPRLVCRDGG